MTDELLPLINTLELRARKIEILPRAISLETQVRWKNPKAKWDVLIARELAVLLIEEGVSILKQVHNVTLPAGGVDKVIEWDR